MTNSKNTKRALFSSAIALILCFSMLLGTTFAWFTDSAATANNVIVAGNLDIEVQYTLDGTTWADLDGADDLFEKDLWEPGHTEVVALKIENVGTLALKYAANMNIVNETVGKNKENGDIKLSDILQVSTLTVEDAGVDPVLGMNIGEMTLKKAFESENAIAWGAPVSFKNGSILEKDMQLFAESTHYVLVKVDMPEEVGNEANHNGTDVPDITFGVNVLATQYTYEEDTFGNKYDENAEYPVDITWDGTSDTTWYNDTDTEFVLNSAEQLAGLSELVDGGNTFAGKTILLASDADLGATDGNGNKINFDPIGHSQEGKAFNGVFDGQGHTIKNMYIQNDLGAWQYEGEYYSLFAYTEGAEIKNVNIENAYISSGRNEAACIVGNAVDTDFSDITISDSTLIGYNNSVGGIAAECYGDCSFTNITVDEDTVIGPLWGTYDVRLGGVVGMVKSSDKVSFSNITVACKIDAINDVAANYQYWLYRYSGMLIGQVDGVSGVADPTGYVTCENVTVIYNDWVNYHYCEDADLGAGSYNGPGEYKYARVEAGTGTDGIDTSACVHNADESHNVLIVFDQLFGGGQGVSGLKTYDGVTVIYNV